MMLFRHLSHYVQKEIVSAENKPSMGSAEDSINVLAGLLDEGQREPTLTGTTPYHGGAAKDALMPSPLRSLYVSAATTWTSANQRSVAS
jgi:hypothetical protein